MVYDLRVYGMIETIQSQSPVEKLFKYCSPSSRPKMFEDQKIMEVSKNWFKKSSTFMGFSIVNNPAVGRPPCAEKSKRRDDPRQTGCKAQMPNSCVP